MNRCLSVTLGNRRTAELELLGSLAPRETAASDEVKARQIAHVCDCVAHGAPQMGRNTGPV
jgi:hypothetical protein